MKIGLLVNSDDLPITFCHLKVVYPHISNLKFGWNIKNEKVALSIHSDIVSFYILYLLHISVSYIKVIHLIEMLNVLNARFMLLQFIITAHKSLKSRIIMMCIIFAHLSKHKLFYFKILLREILNKNYFGKKFTLDDNTTTFPSLIFDSFVWNFRSSWYTRNNRTTTESIHSLNLLDVILIRWCLKYDKLCTRQTNIAQLFKRVCLSFHCF